MNRQDERAHIDAMLGHLGSGRDICHFPGTATEKVALVRTARARGLIVWRKTRARYELTPIGWIRLAPRPRFGVASLIVSTAVGAIVGGAALAAFTWLPADVPPRKASGQSLQVSHPAEPVVRMSRPQQVMFSTGEAETNTETPALEPPTLAVGTPKPPKAEPALTGTKEVTARKPHRKTAHRRRREQGAAWAYVRSWQGQQFRYAGYGERGAWLGYR